MLGFYPIFTFMWILVYYLSTIQYNFFMSKFMVPYFEKTYHSAQMMLFLAGSFLFCRGDSSKHMIPHQEWKGNKLDDGNSGPC